MQQQTHPQPMKEWIPALGLGLSIAGIAVTMAMYWLVVPGLVLGLAGIALGVKARRGGRREIGSVALALGVVALVLVPAILQVASSNEDWGRDCALHPESDPNC